MDIVSHILFPIGFAQVADGCRERNLNAGFFHWKQLLLIGLSGALPDLVSPHFSFEGRYGSVMHSIWFVLAVMIVSGALLLKFKRARALISFCCFALLFHLFCDMISGGINLLAPGGVAMAGGNYIRTRYWVALDATALLLSFYAFLYGRYRGRARSLVLVLGGIVCGGGSVLAFSKLDTESVLIKRVHPDQMDSAQLVRIREAVQTLFMNWEAGVYESLPSEFSEEQRMVMTPQWQKSFYKQISVIFGEYRGVVFTEIAASRFYYPRGFVYRFKGSFSRMPRQPEIRITLDSNGRMILGWFDRYRERLIEY